MHIYEWVSKYNTGVEAIDVEHKNLLTCINKLITVQTLDKAIILKLAEEVSLYAKFHFLSEENLMCLTHYPDLTRHSDGHKRVLKELDSKRRILEESETGLQDYVNFLVKWFIEHTQTTDKDLGKYLQSYKPIPNSPEFTIHRLSMEKN